ATRELVRARLLRRRLRALGRRLDVRRATFPREADRRARSAAAADALDARARRRDASSARLGGGRREPRRGARGRRRRDAPPATSQAQNNLTESGKDVLQGGRTMLGELRTLVPALSIVALWSATASAQGNEPPAQPPAQPAPTTTAQ